MTQMPVVLGSYLVLGIAFALPFVLRGVASIDDSAREASWGFRILILPGVIALWPVMLIKWLHGRSEVS